MTTSSHSCQLAQKIKKELGGPKPEDYKVLRSIRVGETGNNVKKPNDI